MNASKEMILQDCESRIQEAAEPTQRHIVRTTYSGKPINLLNFKSEDVDIEDIAHALSLTNRFNGHTDVPFSVAEHCLIMSYMADDEYKLEALLHDAGEAYVGDLAPDIKVMFPELADIEAVITSTIFEQLHPRYFKPFAEWRYEKSKHVHDLDSLAASLEGRFLRPHHYKSYKDWYAFGITTEIIKQWDGFRKLLARDAVASGNNLEGLFVDRYIELQGKLDNA